jgi:hypothetical protein
MSVVKFPMAVGTKVGHVFEGVYVFKLCVFGKRGYGPDVAALHEVNIKAAKACLRDLGPCHGSPRVVPNFLGGGFAFGPFLAPRKSLAVLTRALIFLEAIVRATPPTGPDFFAPFAPLVVVEGCRTRTITELPLFRGGNLFHCADVNDSPAVKTLFWVCVIAVERFGALNLPARHATRTLCLSIRSHGTKHNSIAGEVNGRTPATRR